MKIRGFCSVESSRTKHQRAQDLKIAFRKIAATKRHFELQLSGESYAVTVSGEIYRAQSAALSGLVCVEANLRGRIELVCDVSGESFTRELDEDVRLFASDGLWGAGGGESIKKSSGGKSHAKYRPESAKRLDGGGRGGSFDGKGGEFHGESWGNFGGESPKESRGEGGKNGESWRESRRDFAAESAQKSRESFGSFDPQNLDVIEFFDGFIDLEFMFQSELESIQLDYHTKE